MKCTLIRLDTGRPFVEEATLVDNGDGSVSFMLPTGMYAGQEPSLQGQPSHYGVRHDGPATQAYQRATLTGSTVVFLTRPQDLPMVYLFAQGQAY